MVKTPMELQELPIELLTPYKFHYMIDHIVYKELFSNTNIIIIINMIVIHIGISSIMMSVFLIYNWI